MKAYHETDKGVLYLGNCLEIMKQLPENSVDTCITSPPYWGLRDYGVDGQLGLEKTPEEYVANMVQLFREVKRVMKADGVMFLNLGDSYYSSNGRNEVSCDTSGKELEGYQENDSFCKSLCGECRKAYLIGKFRSDSLLYPKQSVLPSLTNHEHMESQNGHFPTLDCSPQVDHSLIASQDLTSSLDHEGEPVLSSLESKHSLSCPPHPANSRLLGNSLACPLCGRSSTACVQECAHNLACIDGIVAPSDALNDHRSDKEFSCLALGHIQPERSFCQGKLKQKDLVGIPWMVAFALRADGWYLRQDIIWHKPNPMPESVTDRCTKSHEYIFMLTKSAKYYYDNEAVKEVAKRDWNKSGGNIVGKGVHKRNDGYVDNGDGRDTSEVKEYRNKRSVWTVATKPYKEAHFATYPPELITPCVLTSKPGAVILDPFFGAGTTGVVAIRNRRKYIGCELNPEYCEIAARRIDSELQQTEIEL